MATAVHVKGISFQTTEKEVRDFFSFCGKISSLDVKPERSDAESPKEATVTFEKETAAKTALLLDNTMLGAAEVHVTPASGGSITGSTSSAKDTGSNDTSSNNNNNELSQEDKPRSRIFAEYLAQGYALSDTAIERAINLDKQHGISGRFTNVLQQFDQRTHATENAQAVDQKYGVTQKAQEGWKGLYSYFEKAVETPTGQRLRSFYLQGQQQVLDVHNEARHLADLKTGKSSSDSTAGGVPTAQQADMKHVEVDGKDRTKCNCGGADGKCPCKAGECACTGCSKAGEKTVT